MVKKLAVFIISCVVSIVLSVGVLETCLRIWKPPYIRMQHTNILLERNKTIDNYYTYDSNKIKSHITIRRNSLGFRGPEPPIDFSRHRTILTIGGSTTECILLTEGKTWTDVLNDKLKPRFPDIWINNAGIDGHSTFGHIELLKQYVGMLKPAYALFLIGINDLAIQEKNSYDQTNIVKSVPTASNNLWQSLQNKSMILAYLQYLRSKKGDHAIAHMSNGIVDYRVLGTGTDYQAITEKDSTQYDQLIEAYKTRVRALVKLAHVYSIKPILITQPAVYGFGVDAVTGVNLADIIISDFPENGTPRKGADAWALLERYNAATKAVANELGVPVIDLANEMPKKTQYYYDFVHFTEEGAAVVGEIIERRLANELERNPLPY